MIEGSLAPASFIPVFSLEATPAPDVTPQGFRRHAYGPNAAP
ncbi:MAG TPA: hypothetical protein PLM52_00970 [Tabrizicola sp.]|nr:hypothetical protein [Tabrizicola sp.]